MCLKQKGSLADPVFSDLQHGYPKQCVLVHNLYSNLFITSLVSYKPSLTKQKIQNKFQTILSIVPHVAFRMFSSYLTLQVKVKRQNCQHLPLGLDCNPQNREKWVTSYKDSDTT